MTWIPDETLKRLSDAFRCPPVIADRYELRDALGEGGMGRVYLAYDRELHRPVAVKVLRESLADDAAVDRMLREARIVARLEHAGIVPIHDVGRLSDGRIFYVMKLVRGVRLDSHFAPDAPLPDRLRVFVRVCETVAFAHAHGVIHRDLKPQNIMVGEFGEVLVLDWGVAKVLDAAADAPAVLEGDSGADVDLRSPPSRPTQAPSMDRDDERTQSATLPGTVLGTPAYMSPEQARGELTEVDGRSDVYSLGAMLFFLLTGRPPRTVGLDGPAGVRGRVAESARAANRRVPRPVNSICGKAMSIEPSDRYSTARGVAEDVVRFLNHERVTAHREGWVEWAVRLASANKGLIALVLAYLLMRTLMLVWARV